MKRKLLVVLIGLVMISLVFSGLSVANSQDHNHNTNGEGDEGNYADNNNNPYDDESFPGEGSQQRDGVQW